MVVPNGRIRSISGSWTVTRPEYGSWNMVYAQAACVEPHETRTSSEQYGVLTMCGIVGYAGARPALTIVVDGLRRLEYRGYDSAGIALIGDGTLVTCKRAGKLANLETALADLAEGRESIT